jgi:beta-lactamase regulating signal transducer with metallopeptidase domain
MAFSIIVKASMLLAAAGLADAVIRRRVSAASRYWLWTLTMVGLLLLPALPLALPEWPVISVAQPIADVAPLAPVSDVIVPDAAIHAPVAVVPTPAATLPWSNVLLAIYAGGVLLVLVRLARGHRAMQRLTRQATVVQDPEWMRLLRESMQQLDLYRRVRLLRGRDDTMPMAVGVWRAAIVLPPAADTWSEDRRRAVLLHELAHVARRDCASYLLASIACALYWYHPGVWLVARRLRVERELACDDCVLQAGTGATDYAAHLLELAYTLRLDPVPALAIRMASSRQVEWRMRAALDDARTRTAPTLRSRLIGAGVLAGVILPLAAATTTTVSAFMPVSTEVEKALPDAPQARETSDSQDQRPGTWEIQPSTRDGKERQDGTVYLRLNERGSSRGTTVPLSSLDGLSAAQLAGAGTPVQFRSRREAGTFAFEGSCRGGMCGGTWVFTADPAFVEGLAKRGVGRPSPVEQRRLALADVGLAFVDELKAQGYPVPNVALLVRASDHGVNLSYLRDMTQLGYRVGDVEALIRMRDHGVGPEFVRELAAQGLPKLSADELVRVRDHGVNADFIRAMRELGHSLDVDGLVRARDHGVSPEFARELAALGFQRLPIDELIRLRDHGVSTDYVKALKGLGYDAITTDELVSLRDHGASVDEIRRANERAGSRLSVRRLVDLASRGWSSSQQ